MFRSYIYKVLVTIPLAFTLAGCGGGGGGGGGGGSPPPTPSVTLSAASTSASVTAGSSTTINVTIARGGGFSGAVSVAATGAPSGVTITGGTIAAGSTTLALNVAADASASAGTTNISITGSATGVTIAPVTVALTVNAAPSVALSLAPTAATVVAGESTTVTATIVRAGGFAGAVDIDVTGAPTGVTATAGTIAANATTQTITIETAANATPGTATLSVEATATELTIAPAALALTIEAAASAQIGDDLEGEAAGDLFHVVALSADGSRIVVGAIGNDAAGTNAGHARVFERSGNIWVQLGEDIDGEAADDRFGGAVAISDDGSRVAIGSYLNDGGGNASGHVRVFDFIGGVWTQVGADIDGPAGAGLGHSVAMSASGHRVIIGGPGVGSVNGIARVYELVNNDWTQVGPGFALGGELGHAVAMNDDGTRIAVSHPSASGNTLPGTTRVYDWDGTTWTLVGNLIEGEAAGDNAGHALSMNGSGDIIAIGAPYNIGEGTDGGGVRGGHVRVYRLEGGAWTQVGQDMDGPPGAGFGTSVAISGDGMRLLAGAPYPSIVRLYLFDGTEWQLSETPQFINARRNGNSVAISADGLVGAVGAEYGDTSAGNAAGIVRVYALPEP